MREIKFRAWDKEHKKMWFMGQEGESIEDWTFQAYFNNQNCFEAVIFRCFYNGVGLENKDIKLPIMQYTGFKDKCNKKIYEGDILEKCGCWSIRIEYDKGCFRVRDLDEVRYINQILDCHIDAFAIQDWKVIGNIYENPELLK